MKIKYLTAFLIILVIAAQPVSAGLFEWITGWVTGNTTEEPAEIVCAELSETEFCAGGETACPRATDENGCYYWDCNACEIPEEPTCPELPISMWCSDGETLCPQVTDENGCHQWDCDSCAIQEVPCPALPAEQWCSDGETLCAMRTDSNGCGAWDCGACPPEETCPPIPTTMTCPDCEGTVQDCLCPMRRDENGCHQWDCDSCATQEVACPALPADQRCHNGNPCPRGRDENGCDFWDCSACPKEGCPALPEDLIRRCKETGGYIVEKNRDSRGCPRYIGCEYEAEPIELVGTPVECPAGEELSRQKERCIGAGMEAILVKRGDCEAVKCKERIREEEQRCVENVEEGRKVKEKCAEANGRITKHFDSNGCPMLACVSEEECERDVPAEAYEHCEEKGGELIVKKNNEGCIRLVECARRGDVDIIYDEIEEIPSAAKLLSVALKLETLKIEFDQMIRRLRGIADYYKGVGNQGEAEKFRKVLGIFASANDKIAAVKIKLRERASQITEDDLRDIKHDIKYISEVIMQDALYIILGGEIKLEGGEGVRDDGYTNCGSDSSCWREALRLCEPILFRPSDSDITVKIHGMEDEACMLDAKGHGKSMACRIKNYATLNPDGPDILQYCEGDLVGMIRTGQNPSHEEEMEKDDAREFLKKIEGLGPESSIDFETLPDGTVLQSGDRLSGDEWESWGVTFEFPSEDYLQVFGAKNAYQPIDRLALSPGLGPFEAGGETHDDLNIIFSEPVKAAGFYILDSVTDEPSESVTFYDVSGNVIERMHLRRFVSATHEAGIARIEVLEDSGDSDDVAYDNLYWVRGDE